MVNYPNYLSGSQDDINKRFLEMLLKAEAGDAAAIKAVTDKIGDESTANTILYRIKAVETVIGDEDTPASILGRIKALEDAE